MTLNDSWICHDEFALVNNVVKEYHDPKFKELKKSLKIWIY